MSAFNSDLLAGNAVASATTTHEADPTGTAQASAPTGATDAEIHVPAEPRAPDSNQLKASQRALAAQVDNSGQSSTPSNFKKLLKLGVSNVSGWWGWNGRLNYARKCVTDIPKGLVQGVLAGVSTGLFSLLGSPLHKLIHPQDVKGNLLSHFWEIQKDGLMGMGLSALTDADTDDLADEAVQAQSSGPIYGKRDIQVITDRVKETGRVYTPTKAATFGVGAVAGAAIPTVLAVVVFGPLALGSGVYQWVRGEGSTSQAAETPPTPVANDQVGRAASPPPLGE